MHPVSIPFSKATDFNTEYTKDQQVKTIFLKYLSKKDGELIVEHSVEKKFYFNDNGEPFKELYIEQRGQTTDSLVSAFEFNSDFQVTKQIDRYRSQENRKHVFYNQSGRIIKEVTIEVKNNRADTSSIINYTEAYTDKNFAKRFMLNSENRPFIEQRYYYDDQGRLINKEEDLFITTKSRKESRVYQNDLLKEIRYSNQINNNSNGKYTFEYKAKQLEFIYQYEQEELIKKTAFVYSVSDPNLLEALVIRYPKKEVIEIITIKYTYL